MGVRMGAVWDIELYIKTPSPDLAPARGDAHRSVGTRRERARRGPELNKSLTLPAEVEIEVAISSDDTDEVIASTLCAKRGQA